MLVGRIYWKATEEELNQREEFLRSEVDRLTGKTVMLVHWLLVSDWINLRMSMHGSNNSCESAALICCDVMETVFHQDAKNEARAHAQLSARSQKAAKRSVFVLEITFQQKLFTASHVKEGVVC